MEETHLPLLDGLRARKPEAWQVLMEGYAPLVRREVKRYLSNPDDVEEVAQDVFQAAHQQIDGFERRRRGALRRWLRIIARNQAVNRLREREPPGTGETRVLELLAQVESPGGNDPNDEEEHIRYWLERIDAAARQQHSERDFAIFTAIKRSGEEVSGVADRFGVAEAQVYVICSRVTRTLQNTAAPWAELMEM
jgi:RNA polymerase sigma factor (sigma-70 family)